MTAKSSIRYEFLDPNVEADSYALQLLSDNRDRYIEQSAKTKNGVVPEVTTVAEWRERHGRT